MDKYFESFKKYAFRLELLQEYDVEYEKSDFENFKKTGQVNNDDLVDWHKIIVNAKNRGAVMSRVHVVNKPLSTYLKYEIEGYKANSNIGEKILFLDKNDFDTIDTFIGFDYWLFDDDIVLKMIYDERGKFLCYEEVKSSLKPFIELKNKLLGVSKDFRDYL